MTMTRVLCAYVYNQRRRQCPCVFNVRVTTTVSASLHFHANFIRSGRDPTLTLTVKALRGNEAGFNLVGPLVEHTGTVDVVVFTFFVFNQLHDDRHCPYVVSRTSHVLRRIIRGQAPAILARV
jgi:hypothetical protein